MSSKRVRAPVPDTILRGHTDSVNTVSFINELFIASGAGNGELKIWNLQSRRVEHGFMAHEHSVLSTAVLNGINGSPILLTSGRDGLIKTWSTERLNEPLMALKCDDHTVVSPSVEESKALIWDMRSSSNRPVTVIDETNPHPSTKIGLLTCLLYSSSCSPTESSGPSTVPTQSDAQQLPRVEAISSCSPMVFAGYESGLVRCIDMRTMREVCSHSPHTEPVLAMDLAPLPGGADAATTSLVTASSDNSLHSLRLIHTHTPDRVPGADLSPAPSLSPAHSVAFPTPGVGGVKYRSDGRLLVSGHWDGSVRVFTCKSFKPLAVLRAHRESVFAVDFGPADTTAAGVFVTGSKDCCVCVWSLYADTL